MPTQYSCAQQQMERDTAWQKVSLLHLQQTRLAESRFSKLQMDLRDKQGGGFVQASLTCQGLHTHSVGILSTFVAAMTD